MAERGIEQPLTRRRGLFRARLFALIAVLYVVSIPWYRSDYAPLRLWLGLPDWVTVALGCYLLAAMANALAWGATELEDARPEDADPVAGPESS